MGLFVREFYHDEVLEPGCIDLYKKIKEKYLSEISEEEYAYYLNQKIVKGE